MKTLVLDNYDSFTFNLVQYIQEILGESVDVFRNDAISLDAVAAYDIIVLSPGPGIPEQAGIMPALIQRYASTKIIFGVCLGHQAIGEAFGGKILNLDQVFHGVSTQMKVIEAEAPLFKDIPTSFEGGRYHSWVVERPSLPASLIITAEDEFGQIMAFRHKTYNVRGVQFHPESIMTTQGKAIISNFYRYCCGMDLPVLQEPIEVPS